MDLSMGYTPKVTIQMSYVFFKYKRVYIECKLDVAFGVVLPGWRKDCVGLA